MITRFAPSPTGCLHLGHAYAAKVAHDLAREANGSFLLRFEDIDHTRVREPFYQATEEDLRWLGFSWDEEPIRQLDRLDEYATALEQLKKIGVVYPCFCTRKQIELELAQIVSAPHDEGRSHYTGRCRNLSAAEREERIGKGEAHCWRLNAQHAAELLGPLNFHDRRFGKQDVQILQAGDVILARKDIGTSYHLAVVVDDAFQNITLVTRGEDLLSSTHIHRALQTLLQLPEPEYLHHELVLDKKGKRLAKRDQALAISTLREQRMTKEEALEMITSSVCES